MTGEPRQEISMSKISVVSSEGAKDLSKFEKVETFVHLTASTDAPFTTGKDMVDIGDKLDAIIDVLMIESNQRVRTFTEEQRLIHAKERAIHLGIIREDEREWLLSGVVGERSPSEDKSVPPTPPTPESPPAQSPPSTRNGHYLAGQSGETIKCELMIDNENGDGMHSCGEIITGKVKLHCENKQYKNFIDKKGVVHYFCFDHQAEGKRIIEEMFR